MAQGDTPITVVGNLVADPELRFIPSGAAVANFRIASTREGENRTVFEVEVDEVGPSLKYATANVQRTPRDGNSGYGRPQQQQQQQPQNMGGFGQAPQQPAQQQQQVQQSQPQNDPWNSAPPAGGFGGMDDEPPF